MVVLLYSYICFFLVCFFYENLLIYLHDGLQRYLRSLQVRWLCFLLYLVVELFLVYSFHLLSWIFPIPFWLGFWCLVNLRTFSMCLLKTLCLMALLHWNVLNLVLFVWSRQCFLYSALTIFSSLSHSSFHHATVGLRMFWGWFSLQLVVWFWLGRNVLLLLCFGSVRSLLLCSFWNCVQFALPMPYLCCFFREISLSSSMMMGEVINSLGKSLLHSSSRAIVDLLL